MVNPDIPTFDECIRCRGLVTWPHEICLRCERRSRIVRFLASLWRRWQWR